MKRIGLLLVIALALPIPVTAACEGLGSPCCCTDSPPPASGILSFSATCACEASEAPARVAEPALGGTQPDLASLRDWPGCGGAFPGGAAGKTADLAVGPGSPGGSAAPPTPLLALLCTLRI